MKHHDTTPDLATQTHSDDTGRWVLWNADCKTVISQLPDNSVDSIVTDPPYQTAFMNKAWDVTGIAYDTELWCEALRVLKPGGHLLAFGATRTYHRMACAIEDAGFEIRDSIHWVYGSGFPKSLDVSKAIAKQTDTEAGNAAQWQGWGTALKPAHEPIVVARKLLDGTVAHNITKWGTGAINIDGSRIGTGGQGKWSAPRGGHWRTDTEAKAEMTISTVGRWPANFVHDGSDEVIECFPGEGDSSASRFFANLGFDNLDAHSFTYTAKPVARERDAGLDHLEARHGSEITGRKVGAIGAKYSGHSGRAETPRKNTHPTVKPLALMRWLTRLVTPPHGTVLEPFAGSGTTLAAALLEGFDVLGCELTEEYVPIILGRVQWALAQQEQNTPPTLFDTTPDQ